MAKRNHTTTFTIPPTVYVYCPDCGSRCHDVTFKIFGCAYCDSIGMPTPDWIIEREQMRINKMDIKHNGLD